jgi:hypothetical protein
MSNKIELFYKSLGRMTMEEANSYDLLKNMSELHHAYPDSCGWQPAGISIIL